MEADDYIKVGIDTFWQWEDEGEVLAIAGGNTVIYTRQLIDILSVLAEQGLPLLGSLALVLVATHPERHAMLADLNRRRLHLSEQTTEGQAAMDMLLRIAALPDMYHTGKARVMLLAGLFRQAHNTLNPKRSRQVLDAIKTGDRIRQNAGMTTGKPMLQHEVKVISLLSRRFPDTGSILRAVTGIPVPDEPLPVEDLTTESPATDYIGSLLRHRQTFEVAALVKALQAGLNIPFRLASPGHYPVGGVSDLTNKGELSRLVLSEFANDELVFLSRLANHEALYLNREIPPPTEQKQRIFLIDTSLKSWGTPKTVGFGIALAVATHPKTNTPCVAYTIGTSAYQVELTDQASLIEGLQQLSVCLSPEKGFTDVLTLHSGNPQPEVFLITTAGALSQPPMQQLLIDNPHWLTYLMLTNSSGQVSLYRQYAHGRKLMQQLQLPVHDLWQKKAPPTAAPPRAATRSGSPIGQCPILFPVDPGWRNFLTTGNELAFCLTPERLLLQHQIYKNASLNGWKLVMDELPLKTGQTEIGQLKTGDYVVLQFWHAGKRLHRINLSTGERAETDFSHWGGKHYPSFMFDPATACFYHLKSREVWQIPATGQLTATLINPPDQHLLYQAYQARTKRLQELMLVPWGHRTILKRIQTVSITDRQTLVINEQELILTGNHIRFCKAQPFAARVSAVLRAVNHFVFPDGSSVTVNTAGMLILAGSKKHQPVLYIPSVTNGNLGVATPEEFAGDTYYLDTDRPLKLTAEPLFWQRFIQPFTATIVQYGTKA